MAKKYLRSFETRIDDPFLPTEEDGYLSHDKDRELWKQLDDRNDRFRPLKWHISDSLKVSKITIGQPAIELATIVMSTNPKDQLYFDPKTAIWVELPYDPRQLLNVAFEPEALGELAVKIHKMGLDRLMGVPNFPCELISEACERFRKNGYKYVRESEHLWIPGTKIRAHLLLDVYCTGIKRYLIASYHNQEVFRVFLSETDRLNQNYSLFSGMKLEGRTVKVFHYLYPGDEARDDVKKYPHSESEFDLNDFPDALNLMQKKGWLD